MGQNTNRQTISKIARLLNFRARFDVRTTGLPPLIFITDEQRVPDPRAIIATLPPGSGVIFRHYGSKNRLELARDIKTICRKKYLIFIIAGDYSLARDIEADGLHLPEFIALNPAINVRVWQKRPGKILTAAAHSLKSLHLMRKLNLDAVLVSPVFATASHPYQNPMGILRFNHICRQSTLPIYALGGVNSLNATSLLKTSAIGIAAIGSIVDDNK